MIQINPTLIKFLVIALLVTSVISSAYYKGRRDVYKEWEIHQLEINKQIAELEARSNELTNTVITQYVDRVKVVREKGQERTRYVTQYITPEIDNQCVITNSVIGLLNSAVQNSVPEPTTLTDAGASPFKISDITQNTIDNYATCHEYREQIISLQNWIRDQHALK